MRKIKDLNSVCESWKSGRNVKGEPLKVRACWACYFNLFGYCWLEEYNKGTLCVRLALEGNEEAKQLLHRLIESERE